MLLASLRAKEPYETPDAELQQGHEEKHGDDVD